jgi:hypothetical protein
MKKKPIFKTNLPKKKLTPNLPTKPARDPQHAEGYYQCLCQASKNGLKGSITKLTSQCKINSPAVIQARQQEITKIMSSYWQIGESLGKLLQH